MKIGIKYTGSILNLPSCVADLAPSASHTQLRVILALFNYTAHFSDFEAYLQVLADALSLTVSDVTDALQFWAEKGALSLDGFDSVPQIDRKSVSANTHPTLTGKQIAAFTQKHREFGALCDECQHVMGKSFTAVDFNNLLQLKEYFGFSDEFILLLVEHCVEIEKSSWAYIRKTAANLYDEGINSYSRLENHFAARKNKRSVEYKIRKLLGIGEREFTKNEKTHIEKWLSLKISYELLKKAYEITVDKTNSVSLAYMSKVLDNWLSNGLTTIEAVERASAEYEKKKESKMSSFDTDDFFEAALKRSNERLMKGSKK